MSIVKCLREHGADCSIRYTQFIFGYRCYISIGQIFLRNHYGFTAGELAVSDAMHSALSTPVSGKSSVQKVLVNFLFYVSYIYQLSFRFTLQEEEQPSFYPQD